MAQLTIKQVRDSIESAVLTEQAPIDVKDTIWVQDDCLVLRLENGQSFTVCVGEGE